MGSKKRILLKIFFIFSLFSLSNALFGGVAIEKGISVTTELGVYQSIPAEKHNDELPVRTHLTLGTSLEPVILRLTKKSELSLAISGYYTTRSIVHGVTIWRPFVAVGPSLNYTFHINDYFAFRAATAAFVSVYTQTSEMIPLFRFTVAPEYEIAPNKKKNHWVLTVPISLDVRDSYLSVSTTVGFKWKLDTQKEIVGEKN